MSLKNSSVYGLTWTRSLTMERTPGPLECSVGRQVCSGKGRVCAANEDIRLEIQHMHITNTYTVIRIGQRNSYHQKLHKRHC
jgi:hypothetical protein